MTDRLWQDMPSCLQEKSVLYWKKVTGSRGWKTFASSRETEAGSFGMPLGWVRSVPIVYLEFLLTDSEGVEHRTV